MTDAATALFDRKLAIARHLDCKTQFEALEAADREIAVLIDARTEAERAVGECKGVVAETETMAALAAVLDGRNEPERKLQRERAVQTDPGSITVVVYLRAAEAELAAIDADLDAQKRAARRLERYIEYRTAALRLLGG